MKNFKNQGFKSQKKEILRFSSQKTRKKGLARPSVDFKILKPVFKKKFRNSRILGHLKSQKHPKFNSRLTQGRLGSSQAAIILSMASTSISSYESEWGLFSIPLPSERKTTLGSYGQKTSISGSQHLLIRQAQTSLRSRAQRPTRHSTRRQELCPRLKFVLRIKPIFRERLRKKSPD